MPVDVISHKSFIEPHNCGERTHIVKKNAIDTQRQYIQLRTKSNERVTKPFCLRFWFP